MRALVTGAGGFVGQWLCSALLGDGWDVHGASLGGTPEEGTLNASQRGAVRWHRADMRDRGDVVRVVDAARPDAVFHLAGVSFVPAAGSDPAVAWTTNVDGARVLLGVLAERRAAGALDPTVLVVGSGEQYGAHPAEELPLAETAELRPISVYAKTKVAQEALALEYWRSTGMRIVAVRAFNHSGPGQGASFLLPSLVRRACDARQQGARTIPVGNLSPIRDFLHVQDVVRAYLYLAERGEPGEVYNVCSGTGTRVADVAAMVLDVVAGSPRGRSDDIPPTIQLVPDETLMRPVEVPALVGSHAKLTLTTAWEPKHTLAMLIEDLVYGQAD